MNSEFIWLKGLSDYLYELQQLAEKEYEVQKKIEEDKRKLIHENSFPKATIKDYSYVTDQYGNPVRWGGGENDIVRVVCTNAPFYIETEYSKEIKHLNCKIIFEGGLIAYMPQTQLSFH